MTAAPKPAPAAPPDFTLRRMITFASIVSAILLSANALVCATLGHFLGIPGWLAWQLLPGVVAIAFIPTTILRFRSANPALKMIYAICAVWIGTLNFAFFAAIACWIGDALFLIAGKSVPRFEIATTLFSLALLAAIWGVINARWLRVTRITVPLPNLPEAWRGRTAALVTDLHLGPLSGPSFLRRVLNKLRVLEPDIVFISGDLFDGPTIGLHELVAPWTDYAPPLGTFYVTGNHDEFSERSIYLDAVRSTNIRVLDNEAVSLDGLDLVGVHDRESDDPAQFREILARIHTGRARPAILLAHRPVNLGTSEAAGISLHLSGHTHHGQMWPWNLLVRRIYGPFAYGLHRHGAMWVNTCSGTGTWGPPLRVATKSEIVLIRFS